MFLKERKLIDHFIYAGDIDLQFFEENNARYLGRNVSWTFCTHMSNGKEGFLCKVYEPIQPEIIKRMRSDARDARQRGKDESSQVYWERFHNTWSRQEREASRQSHVENYTRQEERPPLNIPRLELPPSYNRHGERNSNLCWDDERQSWIHISTSPHDNNIRISRSTPSTPISAHQDSYWQYSTSDSGEIFSPITPVPAYGQLPGFVGQTPQRPVSAGPTQQHEWPTGLRKHRSATDLSQSKTAQTLFNISQTSYKWV